MLKLNHLRNLAVWATENAQAASLGAFFGHSFAEFGESLGIPPDPSLFSSQSSQRDSKMEGTSATNAMEVEGAAVGTAILKPKFAPLKAHEMSNGQVQFRKISVPPHRYTPLKKAWLDIYTPILEKMKIDVRMNLKAHKVELKTRKDTPEVGNLQKCADFVHAFMLEFDIVDAVLLMRADEFYVESFEIKDVKTLKGEYLSLAIGRLFGKGGENKVCIRKCNQDSNCDCRLQNSYYRICYKYQGSTEFAL